jgi:outer membrane protein OmpA-like peptidoglycan-associated protein
MKNKLCLTFIICCAFIGVRANNGSNNYSQKQYMDSAIILIPFEYKQSALFHTFTYEVIDSVVNLLLHNDKITLTIKGYSQVDEGSDSVCKWLSEDRATFVKNYILGRGVQEERIALTKGMGVQHSKHSLVDKNNKTRYFRAELVLTFPPPPLPVIVDRDEDGILNEDDTCPDNFGYTENDGCPDSNAIIIPFAPTTSYLIQPTFTVLDSVIKILLSNKTYKIKVEGHAYITEGTPGYCIQLAKEREAMVYKYLLSRNILNSRIITLQSFGTKRPINTGKTPQTMAENCRGQIFIVK